MLTKPRRKLLVSSETRQFGSRQFGGLGVWEDFADFFIARSFRRLYFTHIFIFVYICGPKTHGVDRITNGTNLMVQNKHSKMYKQILFTLNCTFASFRRH